MVKVGYAQFLPAFSEIDKNLEKIEELTLKAKEADLLVFPELASSGYEFIDEDELYKYAEPFETGKTSLLLKRLAVENNMTIVAGYPEISSDIFYNSAVMALSDGKLHNYRKVHLFSRETTMFTPGDKEPEVYDTPAGKVGIMICFDWVFPETARILALKGADIIVHPSNLVLQYCQRAMFARSVENGVFSITCNRIGTEKRVERSLTFTGASQVMSNKGDLLVSAPQDEEHIGIIEIDPTLARNKMLTDYNDILGDRRVELYGRTT